MALASSALMTFAVRMSSMALETPTMRGSRWVPPNPGVMPRPTSGWPNLAFSLARRMSQAMDSSQPPPRAKPLTAAMTGLLMFSSLRKTFPPCTPNFLPSTEEKPFISPMSAPATKDRPAPVRITT